MKNISYKAISGILLAVLGIMVLTRFVTGSLVVQIIVCAVALMFLDLVIPKGATDAQRKHYRKCDRIFVFGLAALVLDALLSHFLVHSEFLKNLIVTPIYICGLGFAVKTFFEVCSTTGGKGEKK